MKKATRTLQGLLALLLALVMAMALVACGSSDSGDTVKIGIFEPTSGQNAGGGKKEILGIEYANSIKPTVTINGEEYTVVLRPESGHLSSEGGNDYYRGVCTYEKHISKDSLPKGDEVYIEICGANSSAVVYFNGKKLISHDGGYQTFRAKLSPVSDENTIKIEVDNSPNDRVYPQMADFTFYGGLYRDVSLIGVNKNRFSLDAFGSSGLFVTPKEKDGGNGYSFPFKIKPFSGSILKLRQPKRTEISSVFSPPQKSEAVAV